MRYLTRGLQNGELDDDEELAARDAYQRRLDQIASRLPASMLTLARDVQLHDAIFESVRWRPSDRQLAITLVAGVSEVGYQTVALTYLGAQLGRDTIESLRLAASSRETQVLFDEVDLDDQRGGDGELIHRMLLWPRDELTMHFRELRLSIAPRADSRVHLGFCAFWELGPDET